MSESLIGVLLVTLLFILILVGLVPELLRWLAQRNVRQRRQLIQSVRRLEQDLETLVAQLDPYRSLQAPQFRHIYQETTALLARAQHSRQAMTAPGSLPFPALGGSRWALPHFASHPQDAGRIFYTARRLRELQEAITSGRESLAAAYQDLDRLRQMPGQFQSDSKTVLAHLEQIREGLQQERGAGITTLLELEQTYGRLRQEAMHLDQRLRATEPISLTETDELGQSLDTTKAATLQLAEDLQRRQQARAQFDAIYLRGRQELVAVEARIDPEDVPETLQFLLATTATMQDETAELRREGQFTQGERLLADGAKILALSGDFIDGRLLLGNLMRGLADSLAANEIAGLQQQWQRVEDELAAQLELIAEREPGAAIPRPVLAVIGGLHARLRDLSAAANTQQQTQQEALRRLEREVHQAMLAMNRAWQSLQRTLPLAEGDPLTKKVQHLTGLRSEVAGKPLPLQKLALAAGELAADIQVAHDYLQFRFTDLGALVRGYPTFVGDIEKDAGSWRCLETQLVSVKEAAAGIQQVWSGVKKTGWLDETHKLLDEVKLLNQQAQEAYADLDQQLTQIEAVVTNIEQTIAYVQSVSEDMESSRVERVLGLVDMQYEQAYQAPQFANALAALQKAETFVNELVVG